MADFMLLKDPQNHLGPYQISMMKLFVKIING